MATIRQRGPGTFQIQAYLGRDQAGNRRFVARTIHGTKADARKAATALQAEVDAGKVRATDDLTFAQLADRWVQARGEGWSKAHRDETVRLLRTHATPYIGAVRVSRLRPTDLETLFTDLRRRGVGQSTRAHVHARIRAALNQAVRWDLIATNPAERIDGPREPRSKAKAATPDDVAKVLAALPDDDLALAAFVRLSAVTGARRGEVCGLRWTDVDLDAGEVSFVRAVSRGEVKSTKTDRPKRLSLGAGTVEALRAWRSIHAATDLADGVRSPWVFPGVIDRGRPVRPDLMTKRWAEVRERAGLGHVRFHDLRHGVGTGGMEEGFGPVDVAGRLGHAHPSITMDVYGHHSPARDRDLADALERRLDLAIEKRRGKGA